MIHPLFHLKGVGGGGGSFACIFMKRGLGKGTSHHYDIITFVGWLQYTVPRKMAEEKKVFQLQSNKIQLS